MAAGARLAAVGGSGCRLGRRAGSAKAAGPGRGAGSELALLRLPCPSWSGRGGGLTLSGRRGALTWRRRQQRQALGSAARVPSAGCGSHNMATAVAGGAAAPGAERGREPGWRRDLAEAAGGEGGRKANRAWAPARAVRLRSLLPRPGPARPGVAPSASGERDPGDAAGEEGRGGDGATPGLARDRDQGWRPSPSARPHTRGWCGSRAASPGRLGLRSPDAPLRPRCGPDPPA